MFIIIKVSIMVKLHLINFKFVLAEVLLQLQDVLGFLRNYTFVMIFGYTTEGITRAFIKRLGDDFVLQLFVLDL
jgi:hypothetical protein